MQEISEAASETRTDRRDRGHEAFALNPNAEKFDGDRRSSDPGTTPDRAEGRKHLELEPDIGPDRGE